ncbi:hypothetical protein ASPTUDRAFT_44122 [Aspergillus tubingensis CBS 134.48]|uniref:Uncharacterized protein n=1 Tax=Aspergillus tubingensis (strain CBS 134.48) TaxID=767770 RepID=A0A1L9N0H2_ASPTC|nr:hypothetical protein ASPTUDRAFT_44122 [Aspergillus tubingensis CBS 134.48]
MQSSPVDNARPHVVAKRPTSEEPNAPPDVKRSRSSDDGEAPPIRSIFAATRMVPFPKKVCSDL